MSMDIYEEIVSLRARGMRAALAIIIAREGAAPRKNAGKMLISEDGRQVGNVGGGLVEADVVRQAKEVMDTGSPKLLSFDLSGIDHDERALVCGGSMQIYIDPVLPDPELFIFGAGHVAKAVAEAAAAAGFRVTVFDDRAKYAAAERFPGAKTVLIKNSGDSGDSVNWEAELGGLNLTSSSYVFVATQRPKTASVIPELIAARKDLNVRRLRDAVRAAVSSNGSSG
jgi:xanthine dehydrogenase accessory factor